MKPKIFIDGQEGTTGLQIHQRLALRQDLELMTIEPENRKDTARRKELMNQADLVFFCLPDQAAIEAAALVENPNTRVIDASTAHRVDPQWVYGFPELEPGRREAIQKALRVANPGCHATGFLSICGPLVKMGILPKDYPVTAFSLTGYSGGGKKMIAQYEGDTQEIELLSPRIYGLNQQHKHLPEMQKLAGLSYPPAFSPIVDDYYKGMATGIMLHNPLLTGSPTAEEIYEQLKTYYAGEKLIRVVGPGEHPALLGANAQAGKDSLELIVSGNHSRTLVTARFDNLGKGASGSAVQNMNIMLGFPETRGLNL